LSVPKDTVELIKEGQGNVLGKKADSINQQSELLDNMNNVPAKSPIQTKNRFSDLGDIKEEDAKI